MNARSVSLCIAVALAGMATAQENGRSSIGGTIGLGGLLTDTDSATRDAAKLHEYRDLASGVLTAFSLTGQGAGHYFQLLGDRLGRNDQSLRLSGGHTTSFQYSLYSERIIHNWTFDARTPYAGVGTTLLTGTLPNLNPATWNTFDLKLQQTNTGGTLEWSNDSPWYIRIDANEVKHEGLKLIAAANGTSPANGFTDTPFPIDYKTSNVALEGGYASRGAQLTVQALRSWFYNDNELLHWQNVFFGGVDTTTLPPDNIMNKLSLSGNVHHLPLDSTLAGRFAYAKTESTVPILANVLSTGATNPATNPSRAVFDGDIVHKTTSLSLYSYPMNRIDTRLYWNRFEKDNRSPQIIFAPAANTGLQCSGANCLTHILSYDKNNVGLDASFRFDVANRVVFGFDHVDIERDRIDFDKTQDQRASLEYRNTSLDSVSVRVKYQQLRRRSRFLQGSAGSDGNDPEYLNRFVASFDTANVDQRLAKLQIDYMPNEWLDLSFEGIYKHNDYLDTVLGRTRDRRREFYGSVSIGDVNILRAFVFANIEFIEYDSLHRNISSVSSGTGVAPNNTPRGFCQSTAPNCYDPSTAPNSNNYNWAATNQDENYAVGVGADWNPRSRWQFNGSVLWQQTRGTVDFTVQPGANPTVPAVAIENYDNTRKLAINLKSTFAISAAWNLVGGYAFERFYFDDIQFNGYQYVIGTGTSASYLSGAHAFPRYKAHSVHLIGNYSF